MRKIAATFLGATSLFATEAVAQPYPPSPYLFLNQAHTWGAPQTFTTSITASNVAVSSGLNLNSSFTWNGTFNNYGAGFYNPQSGGFNGIITVNGTIPPSGAQGTYVNELFYFDGLDVANVAPVAITDQLIVGNTGGRSAFTTYFSDYAAPAVTGDYAYASANFYAYAGVNTGGASGAARSTLYGINPVAFLDSGATYWVGAVGGEVDVGVANGASVNSVIGWHVSLLPNHAVRGSVDDVGFLIAGAGQPVGLTVGLGFGTTSKPTAFDSLSTFIKAFPGVGTTGLTVKNGIDFSSGIAFTNNSYIDGHFAFTGSGEFVSSKITDPNTAPGSGKFKMTVEAGTNAGTCKIVARAGTSVTPVTIVDNVGSGC